MGNDAYSVVIPTLGGPELKNTIASLNSSQQKPAEILVCLPGDDPDTSGVPEAANVQIVKTGKKGQVPQRAIGFQKVSCDLVLQLDDDFELAPDCTSRLIEVLKTLPPESALAPGLYIRSTRDYAYGHTDSTRESFMNWIANGRAGFQSGAMARAGINFAILANASDDPVETQWLAGGCVLHHKANLYLENYYPYPGKAFAEDLLHTFMLRKNGIRLFSDASARAYYDYRPQELTKRAQIKNRFLVYRGFWRYAKLASSSKVRLLAYICFSEYLWFQDRFVLLLKRLFGRG